MARTSHPAGFTLLEMLVALAALGLLAVLLAGSVQFGARAWEGQSRRVDAHAETDAVYTVLRTMLRNAQTMPLEGVGQQPGGQQGVALYLAGQPNSLNFISELPEAIGQGGFYDIAILVSPDSRLLMQWRPHVRSANSAAARPYEETELLRRVSALELSYFAPAAENRPGGWQSSWTQPSALPALIRLRLRFEGGDRRVWRELRVAPIIGAQLG